MMQVKCISTRRIAHPVSQPPLPCQSEGWVLAVAGLVTLLAFPAMGFAQAAPPTSVADSVTSVQLEEVVVSGFREAAKRAQDVKRDAPSVIEAVTAEDLGKFSDVSVSDALARVPGLNIRRQLQPNGGADGITLRGLSGRFVQSTINGRQILGTAGFGGGSNSGRDLDYGTIQSEILSAITVYKSPTASLVESGLAGEIDVSTLRPLDYNLKGGATTFGSLTASDNYDTRRTKSGPKLSGLLGGKFFDDTLGAYLSIAYSKTYSGAPAFTGYPGVRDINVRNADGSVSKLKNVGIYDSYSPVNQNNDYDNRGMSTGLQWKPSGSIEVNVDATYNDYKTHFGGDFGDYYTFYAIDASSDNTIFEPGSYRLDGNQITYYDTSKITRAPGTPVPFPAIPTSLVDSRIKQYYGGLNLVWKADGGASVAFDVSHGHNEVFTDYRGPYGFFTGAASETTIETGGRTTPLITFSNPAALENVNNYIGQGYYYWQEDYTTGERNAFALDGKLPLGEHLTLKAGARYDETTFKFLEFFGNADQQGYGSTIYHIDASMFKGTDSYPYEPVQYPHLDFNAFCAGNGAVCGVTNNGVGSTRGDFPIVATGKPGDVLQFSPNTSYFVREAKTAFYTQLDSEGNLFGLPYTGNIGVRAVHVSEKGKAFQGATYRHGGGNNPIDSQTNLLVEQGNSYWRVLPAGNINFRARDNLALRLSVAQTMSLASYKNLAPQGSVNIFAPDLRTGYHDPNNFQGGNTQLSPTTAWNYDITTEYYTANGGSFTGSLFYKDVKDLITTLTLLNITLPGYGNTLFATSTQPVNADSGYTYGFELGLNQPFTFLPSPWDGFGAQANYYYVDSKVTTTLNGGGTRTGAFNNVSKNNVNATLYYEKYGWSARLAFNYRSTSLVSYADYGQSVYARPESTFDASLSKKLNKNFEITLTGSNINEGSNQAYYRQGATETNFYSYAARPTSYTLSLRANL